MPRQIQRFRRGGQNRVDPVLWAYLNDQAHPSTSGSWAVFVARDPNSSLLSATWDRYRDEILSAWISKFPGSRPRTWWTLDAPRGDELLPTHNGGNSPRRAPLARKLVDATGRSAKRATSIFQDAAGAYFYYGIPMPYRGPDDPVSAMLYFESQATYLQRHQLLTADELRLLGDAEFQRRAVINLRAGWIEDPPLPPYQFC